MYDARESCESAIRLAVQVLALAPSLRCHRDIETHRPQLEELVTQLAATIGNGTVDESHGRKLQISCHILASDLLLRLDMCKNRAKCTATTLAQLWSYACLGVLKERIGLLSKELRRLCVDDSADTSRSHWTSGEQVLPRMGYVSSASDQLKYKPVKDDEAAEADVEATLRNADRTEMLQDFFLENLAFPSMDDREDEVTQAHHRTFEWILESSLLSSGPSGRREAALNYATWLSTKSLGQLYWINGKAGSGKSTLLRFIAQHPKTRVLLQEWAGHSELIKLTFFFWTGGTPLQRSEAGMLRSLLHQLLGQRREIIPWTFPEPWMQCQDTRKRVRMALTWEVPELVPALHDALRLTTKCSKICLFIDGLDEFEGSEDTVIGLVGSIVSISSNVKVCVSSRPWTAFEEAFGQVPHMLLQDLTNVDMEHYVRDQIHTSSKTEQTFSNENLQPLYADIRQQANGVFLWTNLALRYILRSSGDGYSIAALRAKILSLPSDLEDLFRYLLSVGRSETDLREQSRLLRIIRARDDVCDFTGDDSVRAMPLYQLLLAFEGRTAQVSLSIRRCEQRETLTRCNNFADQLDTTCAGLIVLSAEDKRRLGIHTRARTIPSELLESAGRRVHYLHRTFRDFLVYSNLLQETTIDGNVPEEDPHICLLRSHVLRLRSPLEEPEQHRRLDEWWHDDVVPAMTRPLCP